MSMHLSAEVKNGELVIELTGTDSGDEEHISSASVPLSDFFKVEGDDENDFWLLIREAYDAIEELDNFDPRKKEDYQKLKELSRAVDIAEMKIIRHVIRFKSLP